MDRTRPLMSGQLNRGFTLIELMIALTIGLLLMASMFGIVYQSISMSDAMLGQIQLSRQAREAFRMVYEGGVDLTTPAADQRVPGTPGKYVDTVDADITYDPAVGRLVLNEGSSTLSSREISSFTVTCTAVDDPIDACTGTEDRTVTGMFATEPVFTTGQSSAGAGSNADDKRFRYSSFQFDLIDPRVAGNKQAASGDYLGTYNFIVHHRKETP